jgi:hypothetical protein
MSEIRCRACRKDNGSHTSAGPIPRVPHDGDVSLCLYCGTWSVFENGALRPPTGDEQAWIDADPNCGRAARIAAFVFMPGGRS